MKALGLVLLALFVGFVGYQFAYPKLDDWAQFAGYEKRAAAPAAEESVKVAKSSELTDKLKASKTSAETINDPKPVEPPKPEPMPEPPKVVAVKKAPEPEKKKPAEDEFVAPAFKTLDEITKGWTAVPKTIFPRQVKILKDVEFVTMISGNKIGTKMAAGGQVHALDQDGPNLTVAPTPTSPARTLVPLEDTDLKDTLTQAYDTWKSQMTEFRRKEFEAKKNAPKTAIASANTPAGPQRGDKPEKAPDGTYPVLVASMKSGQVTEITPGNVKKWGEPQLEKSGKKEFWTIVVSYTTKTMFGDFDTEARATVYNGKVESWKYTGSGEVVP